MANAHGISVPAKDPARPRLTAMALLGALATALTAAPARADFFEHRWENRRAGGGTWRLSPELRYFSSTENFVPGGGRQAVPGLTGHTRIGGDLNASFGVTDRFTLFGRLAWTRAAVESNLATLAGTTFGLADQSAGASFSVRDGGADALTLDLQVQIDFPLYSNASTLTAGTPLLGDQTTDLTVGAFARLPLLQGSAGALDLEGGTGLTWRSGGYSSAVPWRARLEYRPSERFRLSAGADGQQSLRNGSLVTVAAENPNNGAGGSLRIGAVNASYLDAAGGLGVRLGESTWLDVRAARTVGGEQAPASTLVAAGVSFTLEGRAARERAQARAERRARARREPSPVELTPERYGKPNAGFVKYGAEAKVTRVYDDFSMLRVDRGLDAGIERGQVYDVFPLGADNRLGSPVARAKVTDSRYDGATLVITDRFAEVMVQEGFAVKRLLD